MIDEMPQSTAVIPKPIIIKILLLTTVWLLVFWQPLFSAARVWWSNDTYLHGFFIVPAAFYMMWSKREHWLGESPSYCWWAALPLLAVLLIALVGVIADVQFFQHVGMFASLPLLIMMLVGWRIALSQAFPLLFMLFAVPVGEELIPLFQQITANISVFMVQLTGMPVFRTGLFIEVPAGRFVVAEACSGVRFFIASVVFAAIYAYVSFEDMPRRLVYGILGIIMPIIANGIRVFGIIMVGHFFGMEYAKGADHLLYGWVFFAIVIVLLLVIGELMRPARATAGQNKARRTFNTAWNRVLQLKRLVPVLALLLIYGLAASYFSAPQPTQGSKPETEALGKPIIAKSWSPQYSGGQQVLLELPSSSGSQAELFIAYYETISTGGELISYQNRLFDIDHWSIQRRKMELINYPDDEAGFYVDSTLITSVNGNQRYLLSWYEVAQGRVRSATKAKLLQALDRLTGGTGGGARVVISLPVRGQESATLEELKTLAAKYAGKISGAIPEQ